MHSYLRAIGFSQYNTKRKVETLLKEIIDNPSHKREISTIDENIVELKREFCEGMGIILHGTNNDTFDFDMDYYFPYLTGLYVQTNEEVIIEKHIAQNSYAGVCEDFRVGVSLIFYLQNAMDYISEVFVLEKSVKTLPITLSALSLGATIILPINKSEREINKSKVSVKNRNNLIAAARMGDEEAIESLTIEDLDTYTKISKRIMQEDVFSIVDSSFMPYGIECDQYTIVGDIVEYRTMINQLTGEEVYNISVDCNELSFNIAINKIDLTGEPAVGRRFKGSIWMQGFLNFYE